MSEFQEHTTVPTDVSAGEILRAEREHQGLSIDEVAAQLNLRASLVADLELDRFDQIPVRAYQRGYIRAYARLLGIDEKDVVAAYNRTHGHNDEAEEHRVAPIQTVKPPSRLGKVIFRLMTLLVIIVLIALTLLWWQSRQGAPSFDVGASTESPATEQSGDDDSSAALPPLPEETSDLANAEPTSAASPSATASNTLATSAESAPVTDATANSVATTNTAADTQSNPLPADDDRLQQPPVDGRNGSSIAQEAVPTAANQAGNATQMTLTFNGKSWVNIRDKSGVTLLRGLQDAGSSQKIEGEPPYHLTIGNASDVELQYHGESVDLRRHAGGSNVAKFTLGE